MFCDRLRFLRQHQELSQGEAAKRLNLTHATYCRYETGVHQPDFETLKKIANFFDVSIDYLLENERGSLEAMETVDFEALILHGNYTIKSKFPTAEDRKMLSTIVNAIFENKANSK